MSPSTTHTNYRPHRLRRRLIVQIALAAVIIGALSQYQWFLDEYALATYTLTPEVAALVAPLGLTRTGQAILNEARPQVDDKAAFNTDCQTQHGDLELGCYVDGRIYVLRIDNTSLKPEMETVMAHELLHAAWSRLNGRARTVLGDELEPIYHRLNDTDLNARMAGYATSEPGQETNELHSILGTEVADLQNSSLEAHYRQYFASRSAIVAAHAAYELVFNTQRTQLEQQLATIKSLKAQLSSLNARMEVYKSSGQISSYKRAGAIAEPFGGPGKQLITTYDAAVNEYNALSASIDSHQLTTEPGV